MLCSILSLSNPSICLQRTLGGATARKVRQWSRAIHDAFAQQRRRAGLHTQRDGVTVHARS